MRILPRVRTIIFLCLTGAFLLVGSYLVIKMQGYVIDTNHMRLVKAGALNFRFTPPDASLFINGGERLEKRGLLSRNVFISGLKPETFITRITREGYFDWNKELTVEPGRVTSASHIVLWPKTIETETIATGTQAFWLTAQGPVVKNGTNSLSLRGIPLRGTSVAASRENATFIVTREKNALLFTDLAKPSTTIDIASLFARAMENGPYSTKTRTVREVLLHPFSDTKLIVITKAEAYVLDARKEELELLHAATGTIRAHALSGTVLFTMDEGGIFTANDLVLHTASETRLEKASSTVHMTASEDGSFILLTDAHNTLSLFDRNRETFTKLSEQSIFSSFSPDSARLVFISPSYELSVVYLRDTEDDVPHLRGDIERMNIEETADPSSFAWIDAFPGHFFLSSGDRLLVEEFDIRPPRNRSIIMKKLAAFVEKDGLLYVLGTDGALRTADIGQ